jgi:glutathione synthase/RimK-type ligase-like ATP-grasp enzyme
VPVSQRPGHPKPLRHLVALQHRSRDNTHMSIAVWGSAEPLRDAIVDAIRVAGEDVVVVDPAVSDARDAWMPGSAATLSGTDLTSATAHVLLSFPTRLFGPSENDTAADHAAKRMRAEQRALLFRSALRCAESRGARVYNPTTLCEPFEEKPFQLAAFADAGMPIPDTIITSNNEAALLAIDALAAAGKQAIIKPLIGGHTARLIDDNVRRALHNTPLPGAVILQERIAGDDVRITIIDGDPVSVVRIVSSAVDYRDDRNYRSGGAQYEPVVLPPADLDVAVRAAAVCHHRWSGVDVRWQHGQAAVVLEANSAPRYLDIERKTGVRITAHLVERLMRQPS